MKHAPQDLNKRLFLLLGPPRIGKTTIVQKLVALGKHLRFGGFFTLATKGENGKREFRLITVNGNDKDVPLPNQLLIRPCQLPDVQTIDYVQLEQRGIEALRVAARQASAVIIDELGMIQLHSREFRTAFEEMLASTLPIIATGSAQVSTYLSALRERDDCLTYFVTKENRSVLAETVLSQLARCTTKPINASNTASVASHRH